jgi:hypothetical protein
MASPTLTRDLDVMRAVGRFRMLTRPQVKRWFFAEVSETVVTRFVERVTRKGWLSAERLHGNGVQVLWLTKKGRDVLVGAGVAAADLFPASGPAAAKDFEHTVMIGEAAVWLATKTPPPDELLPGWALLRFFGGRMAVVPDLLALWRPERCSPAALAVEVDLGTEPIQTVLLPKLALLANALHDWLSGCLTTILVLVPRARRRAAVEGALPDLPIPVVVEVLEALPGVNSGVKSS